MGSAGPWARLGNPDFTPWAGPPEDVHGSPGRPGLGLNCGQEISTVWAPGPGHSQSSFLIPGPVGVAGPRVPQPPPPRICLLSCGEPGPLAKLPSPGLLPACQHHGPTSHHVLPLGYLLFPDGETGAMHWGGSPTYQEGTGLEMGSVHFPTYLWRGCVPWKSPLGGPSRGLGLCSVGAQLGTEGTGLFDQWFCPMPGCRGQRAVAKPAPPHAFRPSAKTPFITGSAQLPQSAGWASGERHRPDGQPGVAEPLRNPGCLPKEVPGGS